MNEPSLEEMLRVAEGCGITSLPAAYSNYTRFYDVYFSVENFHVQIQNLIHELACNGLTERLEGSDKLYIKDLDVKEVINRLGVGSE